VGELEANRMRQADAYIGVRGSHNISELSDVPEEGMRRYQQYWWEPVHIKIRVPETKWVVLRYPNASMAQLSKMSTEAFEDFYFDVCTLDYGKMSSAMDALKLRMEQADQVHLKGPGTDLRFSIKGIGAVKCAGLRNIPDGEVYSAPVRDSVEGVISYNAPSIYHGITFTDIKFEFKKGKIVKAMADKTEKLNEILDTDEGARYVGEFALGLNPYILNPMLDILFDEKISGSFHFTPGQAYEATDNGNSSKVHWDLVSIQRPEYGGGEIYFDGELIRRDGLFVPDDLLPLNPENLK
jgi:aminopeptidase